MGRKVTVILGVLALLVAGGFLFITFQAQIGLAMFERIAEARVGTDLRDELSPGLHLAVCGSGSPMPDETRAGPCLGVIAGNRIFIIDSGSGSTRNLGLMRIPAGEIEAAFLTHFHSDHIADLGELMLQRWAEGANTSPLPVYGPEGVGEVVDGFEAAYRLDTGYRVAHHGDTVVPPSGAGGTPIEVDLGDMPNAATVVLDEDGLRVTMFRVVHDPIDPAVGYRFDYRGRSLVLSGDTSYSSSLVEHAQGADLLAHEGLQANLTDILQSQAANVGRENVAIIMEDILSYHTSPEDAARAAREADVDALVFYHMIPPLPSPLLYPAFLGDAEDEFGGPITVSEDRMVFSLPLAAPGVIELNRH